MSDSLKNKVVFITGASSGIGQATAIAFAKAGASVAIADIHAEEGKKTLESIEQAGGKAAYFQCDVSDESSVKAAVSAAFAKFGALHFAFNNAGIGGESAHVADMSAENWSKVIQVNLNGVFYCMHYQIPYILKSGGGSIINCSSILGSVGFAGASAYVAAKHGVIGLTQTAALEYATQGIRVNSVGPGFIETPMLSQAGLLQNAELRAYLESLHPMARLGQSEEVAGLVLFLASAEASFITGQHIHADGGYTTR